MLLLQTIIVIVWIGTNLLWTVWYLQDHPAACIISDNGVTGVAASPGCAGSHPFDFYPFVLLNLAFSILAAYASPIILYAKNYKDMRDGIDFERKRSVDAEAREELAFIARELAELRLRLNSGLTRDFTRTSIDDFVSSLRTDQGDVHAGLSSRSALRR